MPVKLAVIHVANEPSFLGTFPAALKHTLFQPLIKKPSLDPNDHKNFRRSTSNLSF